jgi:hypothetical protein
MWVELENNKCTENFWGEKILVNVPIRRARAKRKDKGMKIFVEVEGGWDCNMTGIVPDSFDTLDSVTTVELVSEYYSTFRINCSLFCTINL